MYLDNYQKNLQSVFKEEIACRFWNYSAYEYPLTLETPFDIYNRMITCVRTRTSSILPAPGYSAPLENEPYLKDKTRLSVREITKRFWTGLRGKRQPAEQKTAPETGTKYVLDYFPAFEDLFPGKGIAIGKGTGQCWVRPIRAHFKDFQSDGISSGDELTCTFAILFKDGLREQVGYMDRIKQSLDFSRWHIYPCGDVISADIYDDHRFKHDMFRTLMGHILEGEINPDSYRFLSSGSMPNMGGASL